MHCEWEEGVPTTTEEVRCDQIDKKKCGLQSARLIKEETDGRALSINRAEKVEIPAYVLIVYINKEFP